jgi:hypothetical protein
VHPGEFYLLLPRGAPNPALVVGSGATSCAIGGRCCIATTPLYRRKGIPLTVGTDSFQQGGNVKLNAPKKFSNFVKGKVPIV